MSNNHFFIGLGSTGGNIIREIRKQVYVRKAFFNEMKEKHGLTLDYLYIDSDRLSLNSSWKVLGHDVSLPVNKRRDIRQVNINTLLDNANNMPAIRPWLGDRKFINNVVGQMSGAPGANQRRRFGRLLFANGASGILSHITSAVHVLQQETGKVGVNFHLLGTLGGGTGSGSLVDMALMLRSTYDDENKYPITAYVLVTDNPGEADVGYFYQNQYSALCDLNTLLASQNVNFELLTDPLGQKYRSSSKALEHCYIVTDKSESGRMVPKKMQEKRLADWLLQTTSLLARNDDPVLIDMFKSFTGEDLLGVNPGESDNGTNVPDRSYAFSSLGIMHWMSPEEQIKELVAYELAHSLLLGIRFSNYKNGDGYLEEELSASCQENYLASQPFKNMGFDLREICAEAKVTDNKDFVQYYRSACKNIEGGARAAKQAEKTVADIEKRLTGEWDSGFAKVGVEDFYKGMGTPNVIDNNVREQIRRFLEPLQEAYYSGKLGIDDAWSVIDRACGKVGGMLDIITSDTPGQSVSHARMECNRLDKACASAREKFCNAGFFASLFGTKKKLMKSYIASASGYYAARTRLCAYVYAAKYLQKLKSEFDSLRNNVRDIRNELIRAINNLDDKVKAQQNELNHLSEAGGNRYVFDQRKVEAFVAKAKQDSVLLDTTRKEMIKSLFNLYCASNQSGNNWFNTVFEHLDFASQCLKWGDSVRASYELSSSLTLCPGILDALYNQIGNNPNECKKQCEDFMKEADVLLQIESAAPQPRMVLNSVMPEMPKKSVLIEIPKAGNDPNLADFTNKLKEHLRNAVFNVPAANVHIIDTKGSESEIAVTICVGYMAARFASSLHTLKQRYDQSVDVNTKAREQVLYFCHLDDDYAQRENLFLPSGKKLMHRFELMIKMGKMLDVISEDAGNNVMFVTEKDITRAEVLCPILLDNTPANAIKGICAKVKEQLQGVQEGKKRIHEIYKQQLDVIAAPLSEAYKKLLAEHDDMMKLAETIFG